MVSPIRTRLIQSAAEPQAAPDVQPSERLGFSVACTRALAVGEQLIEEAASLGRFRSMLSPDQVELGPDGPRLGVPDPAVLRDDPRELTYALGALVYAWTTGQAPPRRQTMPMGHERALRRALAANGLDGAQAELLRRLMGWDTTRRPWPEAALGLLGTGAVGVVAPVAAEVEEAVEEAVAEPAPEPAAELAPEPPTDLAPEPVTELAEVRAEPPPAVSGPDVYAVASDHEILFFPEAGTPFPGPTADVTPRLPSEGGASEYFPQASSEAGDRGFSIPDHTRVVTFPHLFSGGPANAEEDEITDSEGFAPAGEDERTDPEARAHPLGVNLDDTNPSPLPLVDHTDTAAIEVLEPMPAPSQIRLESAQQAPAPARRTQPPRAQGARAGRWIGLTVIIVVVMMGLALAARY